MRILIAAIAIQLMVSVMSLISSNRLLDEIYKDRSVRTDRTCLILTRLDATPQEKRDAGCP